MKQYFKQSAYWFKVISIGVVLGVGIQFAQAWTPPTLPAPDGNLGGPINTSIFDQVKLGGLGVGNFVATAVHVFNKVTSASTVATDSGNTLTTKDYVDARSGGGGGGTVVLEVNTPGAFTPASIWPSTVKVNFTNEVIDTLNAFDLGTDEIRLPAGTYLFDFYSHGCFFLSNNFNGADQLANSIEVNGVQKVASDILVSQLGYNCLAPNKSSVITIATGDVATMHIWHDETAAGVMDSRLVVTSLGGGGGGSGSCLGAVTRPAQNVVHGPAASDFFVTFWNGGNGAGDDYSYICTGPDETNVGKCYCTGLNNTGTCDGSGPGVLTINGRAIGFNSGSAMIKKGDYYHFQHLDPSGDGGATTAILTEFICGG